MGAATGRIASSAQRGARCQVWGVLNVTPDSFSDGGEFLAVDAAVQHALRMVAAGADCIDVGGASSRPAGALYGAGAEPVGAQEELQRVLPAIEGLRARSAVTISIDTTRAEVARAALDAGASIVNDVSGGGDAGLLSAVAERGAELVLMHTRGDGTVAAPHTDYGDVVADVARELSQAVARAREAGVPRERLWVDPGLGFAKTAAQSLRLLSGLERLLQSGQRMLVGASRKGFIGAAARRPDGSTPEPGARDAGTLATVAVCVLAGVHAVRVHDVEGAYQAARVTEAIAAGGEGLP